MIEQSQDQCLGENDSRTEAKKKRTVQRTGSSMVARSQRTDKEMVANPLPQSHGEFGKREVAVIPQNLLVDQNYKRHCSDSSIKAKNPRLDKSICSGEYLQPLAKSRRHKGFAITEVDDVTKDTCEPLASKEPSHVCIDIEKKLKNPTPSSRTFGEDQLSLQNKETLQSGNEQKQSAAIKGSVPVRRNIVIQTQEMYSVFSGEENLESYESVPSEHQQVEIQAKRQTPGVNGSDVGEVVVDKGEEVASESGNVVTHQSVELQANKQTPGVKENDGEEIAVVQNQAVASESGNVLTQQPVELEANKQTPIVNENDVGEIPVDKKQAVTSESFNLVVLSEQQQVEIKESSKQTPCVNENAVGEIAVDQNQAVTSESLNVVASEHQQVEIKESSNQMPGVNESDVGESAVDPKEAISTESINVLTSAGQQVEIEASNQKTGNGSDDGEIIIDQRTSVASESSNVVTSERPQLEIEASYLSSGVNESGGGGGGVDQREAVASAENENDVGETVVDPGEAALTESITAGTSDGQQFEIEGCNQTTGVNGSDIGESSVDQGEAVASGSVNAVSSQHQQLEIEVDSIDHSTVIDPSFSKRKSESKDAILDKQKSDAQWKCVNQIQVQEPQLPSTKSGELHPALESEVLVFSQHQHLQPGTNKQAGVITDSVTVRGSIEDPNQDSDPTLSSAKSDSVLKLENQKTFLSDHEQLEVDPYNKRTMVAENFKEMFEDQSHDSYQGASSSKSGLVHLISENENLPLSDSLQLKTVTSKQTAAKTESGVEGMDVDQISHDLDEARQPLTKDSHAHYEIESNGSLESEQQLVQTEFESQVASINNTSDVAVSKNEFRSSAVSQFRLALFSGKRCDNRVGVGAATKNIVREVVAIESHDPDQTLSTAHSSEFHPSYDNKDTLSSEEQHQASKRSPDKPAMTKSCGAFMDVSGGQDQYQTVISNTSYKNESKGSILTSNQALQENESNTTITGNVDHNIVADSDLLVSVSCEAVGKRHQETQTGRSLEEVAVALPVDDDMLLMDRSKIQRLYSSKSGQVDLLQDNLRVTPLCEWEEHNSKQNVRMTVNDDDRKVAGQWESSLEQIALNKSSSGSQQVQIETSTQMAAMTESGRFSDQTAGVTENDRDRMVVGQKKSPLESASGFGEALFPPETETSLSKGSQLVQLETNNQMASMTGRETFSDQTDGMTENDSDRMVVGQKESPLKSASGVGEASFLPETKTTFSCRFQLETSIQMAGTTGSVEEMDGDEREVNSVSPREGDQTHSTFENKTVFGNKHQQLYSMKSIRVSATAKNVNDQCQNQDPRVALTSNNHICSTAESITRRKRQDEETKNSLSKGDITETSEERMLVDKSELQLGSPSSSGQVHLASEMNQAAPSRYGQSGHETLSQTGITENAEDGMVLGQRQDLGVSSRKEFGQGGRISESRTTLPNDIQEMEANTRNQIVTTAETTYSLKGADLSQGQLVGLGKESGQEHDTPTSRSPLHENRKIQAEKSTHTAVMTDIGNHAVQDSDTATCSNYAMTSGLTHLKTEMWKKLKFSTRVLKGHTGLVCGVDCCNSLLVSGG